MKFILIFITAAMAGGPANIGNAPYKARFDTLPQCEAMRKTLVKPSELADRTHGWQCIPELENGGGAAPVDARNRWNRDKRRAGDGAYDTLADFDYTAARATTSTVHA
jgi:hypothetical protein